jgi:hypothetical protein
MDKFEKAYPALDNLVKEMRPIINKYLPDILDYFLDKEAIIATRAEDLEKFNKLLSNAYEEFEENFPELDIDKKEKNV